MSKYGELSMSYFNKLVFVSCDLCYTCQSWVSEYGYKVHVPLKAPWIIKSIALLLLYKNKVRGSWPCLIILAACLILIINIALVAMLYHIQQTHIMHRLHCMHVYYDIMFVKRIINFIINNVIGLGLLGSPIQLCNLVWPIIWKLSSLRVTQIWILVSSIFEAKIVLLKTTPLRLHNVYGYVSMPQYHITVTILLVVIKKPVIMLVDLHNTYDMCAQNTLQMMSCNSGKNV